MRSVILNLGCGRKRLEDAVNLDITSDTSPDVVHNLDVRPWPFASDQFSNVFAYDVLEHLDNIVSTMDELHRICCDGARIRITVPHFSSPNAFTDPTHRHYFGWHSFDYFTGNHEHCYYTRSRFRMVDRRLMFSPTIFNKLPRRLANRYPARYERAWAWIAPAWFLWFELEVSKEPG